MDINYKWRLAKIVQLLFFLDMKEKDLYDGYLKISRSVWQRIKNGTYPFKATQKYLYLAEGYLEETYRMSLYETTPDTTAMASDVKR
jgi:hypothetical protein